MMNGSMTMPAPAPSGRASTHAGTRTIHCAQRGQRRRRTARAMPWASAATAKAPMMNNVPDHENSGSSVMNRIHARAATPKAMPPRR